MSGEVKYRPNPASRFLGDIPGVAKRNTRITLETGSQGTGESAPKLIPVFSDTPLGVSPPTHAPRQGSYLSFLTAFTRTAAPSPKKLNP